MTDDGKQLLRVGELTLRDFFAAQAMSALIAGPLPGEQELVAAMVARAAYWYADAMLAERAK